MYYIIREDEVYDSYDFGGVINPMNIYINQPRQYGGMVTYNGWFRPMFNNILEFKSNEDDGLMQIVQKDFILSNTSLMSYKSIPQLWYNKVVDEVTAEDISTGNAISYIRDFNVFKSLWDADYYINGTTPIDGYNSPYELPAFFGSKLPKLPNSIVVGDWRSSVPTSTISQELNQIELKYNLTSAIVSMFRTNSSFISNWSDFSNTDNVIDEYIKNTILTYYNISQPKISVDLYYMPFDGKRVHNTLDSSSFVKDDKQNIDGQLGKENDDDIYNIKVPITGNFSYYVSFTLIEK